MTQQIAGEPSSPFHLSQAISDSPRPRDALALEQRRDGRLWALLAERAAPVKLRRCFPWTFPERYISLQTDENEELAFTCELSTGHRGKAKTLFKCLLEALGRSVRAHGQAASPPNGSSASSTSPSSLFVTSPRLSASRAA